MIAGLSTTQVQHILKIPKVDGLHLLSRYLEVDSDDLEEDLRAGSFVDFHYDILQFASDCGLPWKEIAFALQFGNSYFQFLLKNTLPQIIQALHNLAIEYVENGKFSTASAKKLVEYFLSTSVRNYKLYQFVHNEEQEFQIFSLDLKVETPINEMKLKDAQPYPQWNYEQKMRKVHDKELASLQMMKLKEDNLNEIANKLEIEIDRKIQDKEYDNDDLEIATAKGFLSDLADTKMNIVKDSLSMAVEKMKLHSENAMALKAIPVPSEYESNVVDQNLKTMKNDKKGLSSHSRSPRSPKTASSRSSKKKKL